jgi:hypothetical protein
MDNNISTTSNNHSYLPFTPWIFWLQWILLIIGSNFVLRYIFLELSLRYPGGWIESFRSSLLIHAVIYGLVLGGVQWVLLHRYFIWPLSWIGFSIAGWIVVDIWFNIISYWITAWTAIYVVPASAIIAGALLGAVQWFVLRKEVYCAGWWIVASALGWFVSAFISLILSLTNIAKNYGPYTLTDRVAWVFNRTVEETIIVICLIWLLYVTLKRDAEIETGM